jgi:hypothetical protein
VLEQHETCDRPPADACLWRYLDLPRFLSLLHTRALFFARADRLGDPFEGSIAAGTLSARERWIDSLPEPQRNAERRIRSTGVQHLRKTFALSCWHANPHESEAMWSLYASKNAGIAIRSTAQRLFDACEAASEHVYVGRVKYIDYQRDTIPDNNAFWPYLHKRESFEHEKEVRALIWKPDAEIDDGVIVPVSVESLVESVSVSPLAPRWFLDAVIYVVQQCGFSLSVSKSSLSLEPVF